MKSNDVKNQTDADVLQAKVSEEEWLLSSNDISENYRPFLANGYIGLVVGGTGPAWEISRNHFMQGVWLGDYGSEVFAKIADWDLTTFNNGLGDFNQDTGTVSNYTQKLDMYNGIITTDLDWTLNSRTTHINSVIFVSRNDPNLAVIKYSATPVNYSGPVSFKSEVNGMSYPYLAQVENNCSGRGFWLCTSTPNHASTDVAIARMNSFTGTSPVITYNQSNKMINQEAAFNCTSGQTYTVYSYIGIFNSRDDADPVESAKSKMASAETTGYDVWYNNHSAAWNGIWQTDIEIQGTACDIAFHQKLARSNLFYLLQNIRPGGECSLGPKGFSDNGWDGHVFWDTDVWMFPSILVTHTDYAKALLQYRYNTLSGAQVNAALNGYLGAEYAWESGYSGRENAIAPYKYEKYIAANVSQACWQYYLITRDSNWLAGTGYPIISEVAEFIVSRVTYIDTKYHVLNVGSPDEYADERSETGTVNDDAFTNAAFQLALNIAVKAANIVGQTPDSNWSTIALNMYIPYDSANKRYIEYEGFCGQITKQAAAELLIFPLETPMDTDIKINTMRYYSSLMDEKNGPCYSFGAYAAIYSDINDRDKAYDSYVKSYSGYIKNPFNIYSETQTNKNCSFNTGHGGSLMALINGFAGMRIHDDEILFKPCMPRGWTQLRLRNIPIGSGVYDITITGDNTVTVTLKSGIGNITINKVEQP